jgi:hypothetical protein
LKKDRPGRRSPDEPFVVSAGAGHRRQTLTHELEIAMENVLVSPISNSRTSLWIGRVLTGLVVAFMLFDGICKVIAIAPVVDATRQLGFAVEIIRPLGVLLTVSTVLHVIPRTQVVGALLLTAYLGGATATLVHVGRPFWFPVAMGIILWTAFCLRNPRLRALVFSPAN